MKKKLLSLFVAFCMIIPMMFSLAACGNKDDSTAPEAENTSTEAVGSITLAYDSIVYDGFEKKPMVVVSLDNEIIDSENYDVEYRNNVNAGTATVIVTAKEDSEVLEEGFKLTKTFEIERAPMAISSTEELIEQIKYADRNYVITFANDISGKDAGGNIVPIVIHPEILEMDIAIDLNGYDLGSYFYITSDYNGNSTNLYANVEIYNSTNKNSIVGGYDPAIESAIVVNSDLESQFNVRLDNVIFYGYRYGISTIDSSISEAKISAKDCMFSATMVTAENAQDASVGAYLVAGKYVYNFEDCKFEGFGGYYTKSGHHTLTNCDVRAFGNESFVPNYESTGTNLTGAALIVNSAEGYCNVPARGYNKGLEVNIVGGLFTSETNYAIQEFTTYQNIANRQCYAQINVSNDPEIYTSANLSQAWDIETESTLNGLELVHTHKYTIQYNGTHHFEKCECGLTQNRKAHTWGTEKRIIEMLTVEQDGIMEEGCANCDATRTYSYTYDEGVAVFGVDGLENELYDTFADAYAALSAALELSANDYNDVFTTGELTWKIWGKQNIPNNAYAFSGGIEQLVGADGKELVAINVIGANANAEIVLSSKVEIPGVDNTNSKEMTATFKNLAISIDSAVDQIEIGNVDCSSNTAFVVDNCDISNTLYYYKNSEASVTVKNSRFVNDNTDDYAFLIEGNVTSCTFENNIVTGYKNGINIDAQNANVIIKNNVISDNSVRDAGIIQLTAAKSVLFTGNTLYNVAGNAFYFHNAGTITNGATISNNLISAEYIANVDQTDLIVRSMGNTLDIAHRGYCLEKGATVATLESFTLL